MRIMMFRRLRRRRPRASIPVRRGKPATKAQRAMFIAIIALMVVLTIILIMTSRIKPVIAVLARSEARELVIRTITNAVNDEIESGSLEYGRLVTFEKDDSGGITALVTNSALINLLQARITGRIVDNVVNMIDVKMTIPIGNAIGGVMFIGRGPGVPVRIQSVTNVQTKFSNDFSQAGINQTRHKIMLEISCEIELVLSGGHEKTTVTTEVAVAETVIVGTVPNVYADIGGILQ